MRGLIRVRVGGRNLRSRILRSAGGLWFPDVDHVVDRHRNIYAVRRGPEGVLVVPGSNLVTDAGDRYYAQRMAAESPTYDFRVLYLCSAGTPGKAATTSAFTGITDTNKLPSAGYPKSNDADADNDGKGVDVVTWKYQYAKADFGTPSGTITHGLICLTSQSTLPVGENILTGWAFAEAFGKSTNDTLTVYVNHEALGQ